MKTFLSTTVFGLFLVGAFLLPRTSQAQIHEVRQTVFGMDCAPCAHGLQKRLQQIEGVTDVTVSLNKGFAELKFEKGGNAKLETIRKAVKDSGFSARDATIRVSGVLKKENGRVVLVSTTGERYVLERSSKGAAEYSRLERSAAGKQVTVTGVIPEVQKGQKRWILQVLDARA